MTNGETVPLHRVTKGSRVLIVEVPEGKRKSQLIRLGIIKGEFIRCLERLPGGTIVIEKNRREIAIGTALAKAIHVMHIDGDDPKGKPRKRHRYAFGRKS